MQTGGNYTSGKTQQLLEEGTATRAHANTRIQYRGCEQGVRNTSQGRDDKKAGSKVRRAVLGAAGRSQARLKSFH